MAFSTSRKAQITLLLLLGILLLGGFLATSLASYYASRESIRYSQLQAVTVRGRSGRMPSANAAR